MTPVSFNPLPTTSDDQIQDHDHRSLFISPNSTLDSTHNSLSCRSFFNILDQTQTTAITDDHQLMHDQQEDGVVFHGGSSSGEGGMEDGRKVCDDNYSCGREEEERRRGYVDVEESAKWMSSKMRLMRKMMMSPNANTPPPPPHTRKPSNINNTTHTPTFQTHDHDKFQHTTQTTPSSSHHRININSTTRVCADCNTTTTPLWRGGPKGPKSLCNACGIRQRKERRALMAEAGGSLGVNNKEKKGGGNHFAEMKSKWKGRSGSERRRNNIGFKDFAFGFSNSSAVQVFPRDDVAQAALLLMDLSSAFLPI